MYIREITLTCSNSVGQNTLAAEGGFKIFQGESAKLVITPPENVNLTGAAKARLVVKDYAGLGKAGKTTLAAKEIDYDANSIIFELTPNNTSAPSGLYLASVKFIDGDGKVLNASTGILELVETDCSETFAPDAEFTNIVLQARSETLAAEALAQKWAAEEEDVVVANNKYSAFHYAAKAAAYLAQIVSKVAECLGYAQSAQSADSSALGSKNDAFLYSKNAEDSAQAAEASKALAQKWAAENEDTAVANGEYSAKHYARKAAASKTSVDTTVSNFNSTVSGKIQDVETAGTAAVGNVNTAKTNALAEIAASKATHTSQIAELQLAKLNRGTIHYAGGSVTIAGLIQTFPFSICFTTRYLSTETPSLNSPQLLNIGGLGGYVQTTGIAIWAPYAASRALNIRGRFVGGGTLYEKNVANFFDGTDKVCVFVATTTGLKIYINGNLVDTLAWTASDFASARAITIGGNANEQTLSRVKAFNFDMSAAGAPYTITDYAAGIDEPPMAHTPRNTIYNTDPDMGASTDGGWATTGTHGVWNAGVGTYRTSYIANADLTGDAEAAGLGIAYAVDLSTKTNPNGYGVIAGLNNTQISLLPFAGKTIKIRASFYAKKVSENNYSLQIRTNSATTANNSLQIYSWAASNFNTSTWTKIDEIFEFTVPASTSIARPIAIFATGGDTASYRIANFQFEVLGVSLLSLADYTFDGEILDASGNGKHATVSGNVAGTNDTAVETLYQKIAARISNNSQ